MSQILNLFLLLILLARASSFPSSTTPQKTGRCRGGALNYLVSVSSLQGCVEACDNDKRCHHYSHHMSDASHPYHEHCLLFSSGNCDLNDLMYSGPQSHWISGRRTKALVKCPHSTVHMMLLQLIRATRSTTV